MLPTGSHGLRLPGDSAAGAVFSGEAGIVTSHSTETNVSSFIPTVEYLFVAEEEAGSVDGVSEAVSSVSHCWRGRALPANHLCKSLCSVFSGEN